MLFWCGGSKDSNDYFDRKLEMERCSGNANLVVTEDDLTPLLQYHLRILILLANCSLGPRLFAIYPISDLLTGILDRATVFPIRKELMRLLIVMVQISVDRAEKSELFWELLDIIIQHFDGLQNEFVTLSKSTYLRIQKGEWIQLCAELLGSFFEKFELETFSSDMRVDKSGRASVVDPRIVMHKLYKSIRSLIEFNAGKLGTVLKAELEHAAATINLHLDQESQHGDENDTTETKLQLLRMNHQRNSVVFADVQQAQYRKQFNTFLSLLKLESKDSREEILQFFKSIPSVDDPVGSDVRLEPLIKKLTTHFRCMIQKSPLSRSLDTDSIESCSWVLKALRLVVESELHFSCDNLHNADSTIASDSPQLSNIRKIFNENGVVNLCMDLIAVGVDHSIYLEAMKVLIALLYNAGGVVYIQQTVYRYLVGTDSFHFFELIKEMIENLKSWTMKENENMDRGEMIYKERSALDKVPEDSIVLYLLQGFCEGSFVPIRDQLREQRGNSKILNILELLASFVGILTRTECICQNYLGSVLLRTICRLVQGPCKGNQDQFVLHTDLLISLNRMIRDSRTKSYNTSLDLLEQHELLKEGLVEVIRSIIEGHYETSLVYDRISTTIDMNLLHLLIFPSFEKSLALMQSKENSPAVVHLQQISDISPAQAKYLVLVQHMRKSIDASFQGEEQVKSLQQATASVEIVFDQQVHIVYFHIPEFLLDISVESKNRVIETVNNHTTGSRELKLIDFVKQVKKLYR